MGGGPPAAHERGHPRGARRWTTTCSSWPAGGRRSSGCCAGASSPSPTSRCDSGVGVAGVRADRPDGVAPVVTGVELEDGTVLDADLVIATTGRRGDVPAWLAVHGVEIPETVGDAGVVYFSRFYRSDASRGLRVPRRASARGSSPASSVPMPVPIRSPPWWTRTTASCAPTSSDSDRFDATMRLLPELADVAAADGTPIHPVHCMTGLINRQRRYTDTDGAPLVVGLLACGDAHTTTNPAYGRGQSLALLQATMIADGPRRARRPRRGRPPATRRQRRPRGALVPLLRPHRSDAIDGAGPRCPARRQVGRGRRRVRPRRDAGPRLVTTWTCCGRCCGCSTCSSLPRPSSRSSRRSRRPPRRPRRSTGPTDPADRAARDPPATSSSPSSPDPHHRRTTCPTSPASPSSGSTSPSGTSPSRPAGPGRPTAVR